MPHGMTKIATTRTTTTPQQEEEPSISFYSSRRLKLYTPAEIEHCENTERLVTEGLKCSKLYRILLVSLLPCYMVVTIP
jgi:hypothetical protein